MFLNKNFFILFALLILLFSGCSLNKKTETQIVDEDWKKYCIDSLGIELEYPPSWSLYRNEHIFYLREGDNPGNIMLMNGGIFSDLEKEDIEKDDHTIDSKIIEINGIKVIEKKFKPIEPKNTAAVKGYYFLTPSDRYVAAMNNFSDRNADIFEKVVKRVKVVGENGCNPISENKEEEKKATTTVNEVTDSYWYSLKVDDKNSGWYIFKDKINGFSIKYPEPLIYVKDAGGIPGGSIIFQIQFPYNENGGGEVFDFSKMVIAKYDNKDKDLIVLAEETAKNKKAENFFSCTIGGLKAKCFNYKVYYNDIEIKDSYAEDVFFEKENVIYRAFFFASGKTKDKYKDKFNQIKNKIEFIE